MKTPQQIFDTTLNHLRKQGHAAFITDIGGKRDCRYRTASGDSCAVGCHIPDADYDPNIESLAATSTQPEMRYLIERIELTPHVDLLRLMQLAHDGALVDQGCEAWEVRMQSIAEQFDLSYTPLEQPGLQQSCD